MVPVFNDTHASAMNAVAPPYRKERLSTCRTKVKYWSGRNGMVAQSENSIHCTAVMKRERAMACSCRSRSVSPVNTHHTHFEDISQVTHKFPFTKYWHWAIYSELRFLFGHWQILCWINSFLRFVKWLHNPGLPLSLLLKRNPACCYATGLHSLHKYLKIK